MLQARTGLAVIASLFLVGVPAARADIILNMTQPSGVTSGTINGAFFSLTDQQPAGTGFRHSFLRVGQMAGTSQPLTQGYNTSVRPVQFDEFSDPNFTRPLSLSAVPIVTIGGVQYRAFVLDVNQTGANPDLSIQDIEIYQASTGAVSNYPGFGGQATLIYDLEAGMAGNRIDLTFRRGSGDEDMFAYIPNALFDPARPFVVLYSRFGSSATEPGFVNNDGFEEWAVRRADDPGGGPGGVVPVPPSVALMGLGGLGLALAGIRRRLAA